MTETEELKFGAFISYSHDDSRFARWLAKQLEVFRTPKPLVGTEGEYGPVKSAIGRVFRDDEELGASPHLGSRIEQALSDSASLIVLCSPAASISKWVDLEIQLFRKFHPSRPIFAIMVARGADGTTTFPPSLKPQVNQGDDLGEEPLAVDFTTQDRRLAILKLVSGLLGTDFDQLYQRERRRANRRLTFLATGVSGIAVVMGILALVALGQARLAESNAEKALQNERTAAVERDRALRNERVAASERDKAVKSDLRSRELLARSIASERRAAQNAELARASEYAARESAARAVRSAEQARSEQQAALRAREAAFDALNRTFTRLADDRYRENPALAELQRDVLTEMMPVYVRLIGEPGRDAKTVAGYAQALDGLAGLQADWVSIEQANADYGRLIEALSAPDIVNDAAISALRDRIALRHAAILVSYGDGQLARERLNGLTLAASNSPEARCLGFASKVLLDGDPTDSAALRDDARDVVIGTTAADFDSTVGRIECSLVAAESYVANNEFDDAFDLTEIAANEIARQRIRYPESPTLTNLSVKRRLVDLEFVVRAAAIKPPTVPDAPSDVPTRRKMPDTEAIPSYLRQELDEIEQELLAALSLAPGNRKLLEAKFFLQVAQSRYGGVADSTNPAWLKTAEVLIRRDPSSRVIAEALAEGVSDVTADTKDLAVRQCMDRVERAESLSQQVPDAYAAQRLLVASYRCIRAIAAAYPEREDLQQQYLESRGKIDAAGLKLITVVGSAQSKLRMSLVNGMIGEAYRRTDDQGFPNLLEHLKRELDLYPNSYRNVAIFYLYIYNVAQAFAIQKGPEAARDFVNQFPCDGGDPKAAVCGAVRQDAVRGVFGAELAAALKSEPTTTETPVNVIGWVGLPSAVRLEVGLVNNHLPVEVFVINNDRITSFDDLEYSRGAIDPSDLETLQRQHLDAKRFLELALKLDIDPVEAYRRYRFNEPLSETDEQKLAAALEAKVQAHTGAEAQAALSVLDDPNVGRIGLSWKTINGTPVVSSLVEGAPASRAGIAVGDRILKVDGKPAYRLPPEQLWAAGEQGSKVTLTLSRLGLPQPFTVDLVREKVTQSSETPRNPMVEAVAETPSTGSTPPGGAPEGGATTWKTSAFSRNSRPVELDEALLNEKVVIVLQGKNIYGDQIYTYLQLTLRELQRLRDTMRAQKDFMPSDYGTVLAASKGSPSRRTRAWLAEKYNMIDVPRPKGPRP